MGLERRGNGVYYYKKRRIGKRVVSEYSGAGELGRLTHLLDQQSLQEARQEKEEKQRSFQAEKAKQDEIDRGIDAFCQEAEAVEKALLLINGYHKHSRTWRRKRK